MFGDGHTMGRFRRDLDRLFGDFLGDAWAPEGRAFPPVNLWEDEQNFYAEAEVPGLKLADIDIHLMGNELSLRGERKSETQEGVSYHRQERETGGFARVVRLPVEVEAGKVEAALKNGILTITLPKAAAARPRRIEVKAAGK
jgi:HSP20 family protein